MVFVLLFLALLQAPVQSPALLQDEPLTLPAIVYPADARAARIQGTVRLQINVDPSGHVLEVRALDGPPQLRQAAIDAYSQATYRPILIGGKAAPAIIATRVDFTLTEAPPSGDMQVNARFQPLHARCQQQSATHHPAALTTCREALAMTANFSPAAELEARATAYNDLVLLLIADGKKSTQLPEAGILADQAVALLDHTSGADPHKPAVALAYITRAEVRSLANELDGAAADCIVAEEVLQTLLADQGRKSAVKLDETETERAGNYRVQLRETLLLHAVVLDRQHRTKEARLVRSRAGNL